MLYKIYEEETNIIYYLSINDIIKLIKNNIDNTFYKYIENIKIKINNKIIKTEFICHRINTINELQNIDKEFGVEIDLRDENDKIILSHDPFYKDESDNFEDYLKDYKNNTLILNIKSERIEIECLKLLDKYNVTNYFFLDSSFPMIYLLNKTYNNNKFAYRFSEYESLDNFIKNKEMYKYIWVDCFNNFPLNKENYKIIKENNIKICIVSPELQKQFEKIKEYREIIIDNDIIPDMICCKYYNIIYWI